MNTTFDILVIVLSCLLGIFLIISIVFVSYGVKVARSVRRVVEKGEQFVDSAEAAAEMFKRAAGPVNILRSLTNIVETIVKHKGGKS